MARIARLGSAALPDLSDQQKIARRLARIEGQIAGIARMVVKERSQKDIALQLAATRAALQEVAWLIVAEHLDATLRASTRDDERKIILDAIGSMVRQVRNL